MKKKIILVDDHNIFRQGLKLLIEKEESFVVIGEAISPQDLFVQLETKEPDVIILNLMLPNKYVVDICKKLHQQFPKIYVLIIAINATDYAVLDCVINGARGIIWKDTTAEQFIKALQLVISGERYLTIPESQMVKQVITHAYEKHADDYNPTVLSKREEEVVKLFAQGLSYKDIGNHLGISPRTVESHKNNILSKLNLNSVNEMLGYAIKHRLIQL